MKNIVTTILAALVIITSGLMAQAQGHLQKYLTAQAANHPDITNGLPALWPLNNFKVPSDYVLTTNDVAEGWQLASQQDYDAAVDGMRAAYRAYVAAQIEDYNIPARVFINRLTADEFKLIKGHVATNLASPDPKFAMLWETVPAGLVGPPDGVNEERKHTRQIRNYLRDVLLFTNNRLDKLFAKP